MEHPPKQGLKPAGSGIDEGNGKRVLMEHPPKQGLKLEKFGIPWVDVEGFNGTSTKTRIETSRQSSLHIRRGFRVLMEHPPKQGLKHEKR